MKPQVSHALEEELARRGVSVHVDPTYDRAGSVEYALRRKHDSLGQVVVREAGYTTPPCQSAFEDLEQQHGLDGLSLVSNSYLNEAERRRGLGALLYRAALEDQASKGNAVAPDNCGLGTTSDDAMRAWDSLARRYPSIRYDDPAEAREGDEPSTYGYVVFARSLR